MPPKKKSQPSLICTAKKNQRPKFFFPLFAQKKAWKKNKYNSDDAFF